ncbi:putative aconitate hydratase 2 [Drechslerella stenobrocha 248]|uniref:Putative aconitate hydratase 2 n=1 Tax=Drechslerella stenobrocha 248 TaxID=1043628 RepID=W7I0T2_9PEZI|nr:putative aconitate hydratase 2 [Drechslerella stenobrocha 248]
MSSALRLQPRHRHLPHFSRLFATASATPKVHPSCEARTPPYDKLRRNYETVRRVLGSGQPLTLAEKILYSHLENPEAALAGKNAHSLRGNEYLKLKVDRVAMQDASAQMALLQFMSCGLPQTAVPASIHCDHMIVGERGADVDLPESIAGNKEIFDFLESAAKKYGVEFWAPGSGIIHQTVLENYSAPGLMMLGTDSHTPNGGGLGAICIGVGGADAVDALVDAPWELRAPKVLGVRLEGQLNGWASPKDVILNLAGQLTVRGGTGYIVEYHGEGVQSLSCTGMATICNMGAEIGATTSLFPFTPSMSRYLHATGRAPIAKRAVATGDFLLADPNVGYDKLITIDLSKLEPHINGPFTPDLSTPLSKFKDVVHENSWPRDLKAGLIGSCTNSSYQDMTRVENIVKQAKEAGLKPKVDFFVTPGSEQIRATLERDRQWKRTDGVKKGDTNAILTSFNRNFRARNDGNPDTMNFLASPEIVTAMVYSGRMDFNPTRDSIETPSGSPFKFSPPHGKELPHYGFEAGRPDFFPAMAPPDPSIKVVISQSSSRLAVLEPFPRFPNTELTDLRVLVKVKGKCTTDHISAAGKWLAYKGHLENISNNTLIGALNEETNAINAVVDFDGSTTSIPDLARRWKNKGLGWLVVAEWNYGEGSAREHAALQPRYLGGSIVLAKSFARIHETNLKKQGLVPLTFVDEADYDLIAPRDQITTVGLRDMLSNGGQGRVDLQVTKETTGEKIVIETAHTFSKDQANWVLAGSALNLLGETARASKA